MADTQDGARQLVVLALGEERYALPITQVQEIIRYSEPRGIASNTSWIRGVISLRGKIVPVCDLGSRLGTSTELADDAKIVIVETGAGTAGVIVDDVDEVLTVGSDHINDVPGGGAEFVEAVAEVQDRLVLLLDPVRLLSGVELAAP